MRVDFFFFSVLPAVSISFVRNLGQNKTECGGGWGWGGGEPDSAEDNGWTRDLRSCGPMRAYLQGNEAQTDVFAET